MMLSFDPGPSKRYLELVGQWRKKLTEDGYGYGKVFHLSHKHASRDLRKENLEKKTDNVHTTIQSTRKVAPLPDVKKLRARGAFGGRTCKTR